MSVISATVAQAGAVGDLDERLRQLVGVLAGGHERAGAGLDVEHERVEARGELLGQDRGDDQRDRLDRAGGVADRVQAAVGGREVGGLADDRAAGLGARRGGSPRSPASTRSRGSRRACRASRRCGRGRGRRSSAPRRRRRRGSGRGSARPCRRRRRSSACRAPAGRGPSAGRCPSRASPWSARSRSSPSRPAQEERHRERADLGVGEPAVGDPGDQEGDLLGAQRRAVALAADDLWGEHRLVGARLRRRPTQESASRPLAPKRNVCGVVQPSPMISSASAR